MSGWAIAAIILAVVVSVGSLLYMVLNRKNSNGVSTPPYDEEVADAPDDKERAIGQPCELPNGKSGTYILETSTGKYKCKPISLGSPCLAGGSVNAGAGLSGVYAKSGNRFVCKVVGDSCTTLNGANGRINRYGACIPGNTGVNPNNNFTTVERG